MAEAPDTRAADTRERILTAAEDLLRRYGPAKTTVADVARALHMSHANVYRHFASKADLQDAVARRWLHGLIEPLSPIVAGPGPADRRLEAWLLALAAAKRQKVHGDPEMFATYHAIVEAARDVVAEHVAELRRQVAAILRDGVAQGCFRVEDPDAAAMSVLEATLRHHHPQHVLAEGGQDRTPELRRIIALLTAGLRAGVV